MAGQNAIPRELNIFIVTPRGLARQGLRLIVEQDEDLRVVGFAANPDEAVQSLAQTQADVVIVVSNLRHQDCVATTQHIKAAYPTLHVLILSSDIRPEHVQAALAAGATGYMPLDAEPDDLLRAIYTVQRGELMLHATIVPRLLSHLGTQRSEDPTPAVGDLTHREREILAHLARGLSDQDIAQALFISVRTVQSHLAHIYAKLNAHSRTEAALIAVREGWASPMESQ